MSPTTRKNVATAQMPRCRWYLADDARTEQGGKISLLGLYLDDTVIVQMPPEAPEPSLEDPIAIESLTILCVLTNFEGAADFDLLLRYEGIAGPALGRTVTVESTNKSAAISLVSKFRPHLIPGFGDMVFSISSPALGFREEFPFRVARRDLGAEPQSARVTLKPRPEDRAPRIAARGGKNAPAPAKKVRAPAGRSQVRKRGTER